MVLDHRRRCVDDVPAGHRETLAEVDVLEVHEEGLVEAAHGFERLTAHQQARPGEPP